MKKTWQIHSSMGGSVRSIEVTGNTIAVVDNTQVMVDDVTIDVQEPIIGVDEMPEPGSEDNPKVIYPY